MRVGNGAAGQEQLDIYGDLMQTAWIYARAGGELDRDTGRRLAEVADLVCAIRRRPDSGIWEVRSEPLHFTHSKMLCWVALDRAQRLARHGHIAGAHAGRWLAEAEAIRAFVDEHCWSADTGSYVRSAGSRELDASLLLGALMDYPAGRDPQMAATISAVRRELRHGALLDRYSGEDGLAGGEGAFLCCSFWLADALAPRRTHRRGHRADGPADRPRKRRRALRGGGGPASVPARSIPASTVAAVVSNPKWLPIGCRGVGIRHRGSSSEREAWEG